MEVAKKFKTALNRTFNENGGVFWQGVNDDQLTRYIMKKVKEFCENDGRVLFGSLTIGRQTNLKSVNRQGEFVEEDDSVDQREDFDSSVYILNEKVQVSCHKCYFTLVLRIKYTKRTTISHFKIICLQF